ncbi:MAG: ABC transporter permease [Spirochaetales bacterium]|jgi:ribose/xylose/arabinose/galactoside ABC-type transport system permease subunit|nr:ABC transporter permease [Spirochaetales bacterium]
MGGVDKENGGGAAPVDGGDEKSTFSKNLRRFFRLKELGIAIPMILIFVIIGIINPRFFSRVNIINMLRNSAFVFVIGVTMTSVFIGGGLDLSVGSTLALGGVISGLALLAGVPIWISVILGVLVGSTVGFLNGLFIARFKIPSFIVTLGMMYVARGIVQFLTRGNPVYPLPINFNFLGQGFVFGIPVVVIVALVLGIIGHIVLTKTVFGRSIFATGGNSETARVSGINIVQISLLTYVLNGTASGLAGVLTAARLGSALSNAGTGMELTVIAAVIIGGTSLFGGSGSVVGTAVGALLMSVIANGMVFLKVSIYLQSVVIGMIIILAVGLDQYNRKRLGMT